MGEESILRLTHTSHPNLLTMSVLCFILEVIKRLLSQNLVNTLGPLMISFSILPLQILSL